MVTNVCILYYCLGNLSSEQGEIALFVGMYGVDFLKEVGQSCTAVSLLLGWLCYVWIWVPPQAEKIYLMPVHLLVAPGKC